MKIKIFNREICVCALLATNSFMRRKQRRNGEKMPIDKTLISGSTSMLLLRLLEEKDMYGYEMIESLQKKSNNVFMLKAGTLYALLHSLEGKHYLTSYESEVNGKQRKYYSITKEGRKYLKARKEEWQEYQTAVLNVLWEVTV